MDSKFTKDELEFLEKNVELDISGDGYKQIMTLITCDVGTVRGNVINNIEGRVGGNIWGGVSGFVGGKTKNGFSFGEAMLAIVSSLAVLVILLAIALAIS